MPTRTSGDSPSDHPPRRTSPGRGRHSAAATTPVEARPAAGKHAAAEPAARPAAAAHRAEARRHARPERAHRAAGARRLPRARTAVAAVLLVAAASVVVQAGVKIQLGSGDAASAALSSQFTVSNGTIRRATGNPAPATGSQASLWSNSSTATTVLEGSGRVLVGGIGDECQGWPTVEGTVDGRRLGATTLVSRTEYGTYGVGGTTLPEGTHKVVLRLVNDRYEPGTCDRNAHLGYARMEFPAGDPQPIKPVAPVIPPLPTLTPAPTTPAPTTAAPTSAAPTSTTAPRPAPPTGPAAGPPRGGRPGPGNTGVPEGTKLTVHEGDLTVRKDGTVIDGLDIRGFLKIEASDVTVRRSVIRGGVAKGPGFAALVAAYGDHRDFVIEDSTLVASNPSGWMDGIKGRNFTARRLDVSNVVDTALIFGDNVTIEGSWFHGNTYYTPWPSAPDNQTHNDSLQIQGGTNIVVRNNVFEDSHNTAIMVTQDYSRTSNVQLVGNWLSGGRCTVNLSEKGKGPITGFRLSGNRFGSQAIKGCAVIAPDSSRPSLDGDVWDATGEPIVVSKGR